MRELLILFVIGCLVLSCSKSDVKTNTTIIGEWNWIKSTGGFSGSIFNPKNTEENRKLIISSDTIKYFTNDSLIDKLEYKIELIEVSDEFREVIIRESDNAFRQLYELNLNKLILTDYCNDCFVSEYKRE